MNASESGSRSDFERLLYSPHRALDATLDLGALPRRLLRLFYPLWRVKVTGRKRVAGDFSELEWFIVRGIHGGLTATAALAQFFGLEPRFVGKLVDFLRGIGHIEGDDYLALTPLGQESFQARVRYQELTEDAWLYFDGLDSRPLTLEHYAIPVYTDLAINSSFQAFYRFGRRWDTLSLDALMQHPDRARFNLPDEITHIEPPRENDPAAVHIPLYVVERQSQAGVEDDMPFFVFSRIRSLRDAVLEEVINRDFLTLDTLRLTPAGSLVAAVNDVMARRGLKDDEWYLQPESPWGAQVMVDGQAVRRLARRGSGGDQRLLSARDVGGYLLAYDWCVWLTCDDAELRHDAAAARLVEWLQFTPTLPTAQDLARRQALLGERLHVPALSSEALTEVAARQGMTRALERLDALVIEA